MFLVNRWRVTGPVLGLIDSVAEKAGFWPVPTEPAPVEEAKSDPVPVQAPAPAPAPGSAPETDFDADEVEPATA
jgi:hypothetical protein